MDAVRATAILKKLYSLLLLLLLPAAPALAVPHTFANGEPADANMVNQNFEALDQSLELLEDTVSNLPTEQAVVPSGAIIFFAGDCPTGWPEYGPMQGRTLVGVQQGGTVAGTRGASLSNLGARTITQVPAHRHEVDPPNTSTNTTGNHRHGMLTRQDDYNVSGGSGPSFGADNGPYTTHGANYTSYAGNHAHSVNIGAFNSGSTGVSTVDVTMPYIQLRACVAP